MVRNYIRSAFLISAAMVLCLAPVSAQTPEERPGKDEDFRHLVFRLDLHELQPKQVTVAEGWYYVRILNGVVPAELDIRILDDKAVEKKKTRAKAQTSRSAMFVRLRAGKHVLSINDDPRWQAEIQVTDSKGK